MRVKSGQLGGVVFFRQGSGMQAGCPPIYAVVNESKD
jgi:hypothetical protein